MQRFAYWIVEAWLQLCGVLVDQCTVDFILVSSPKGYIFTLSSTKGMINCEEWERASTSCDVRRLRNTL